MPARARRGPWRPGHGRTARCPRTTARTSCVTPIMRSLAISVASTPAPLADRAAARPGRGLAVQLGHPAHQLLRCHVLHVRGDGPPVPERVHNVAVPVTVELVLRGTLHGRAELYGPCDDRIHVLDVDEQRSRGAGQPTGRWRLGSPLRVLILDDDDRIPDLDLGMGD